ncbi:MAG: TRAP transporter small permease subunit [Deltaproteobacteria bacterium]|jgi:TRAP-type mannitol/chloroaromatic compound transport system permease small subunit|nr:TRAP transporter small permease subunit [Deltaproteobacteria bacterium]
MNILIKISNTIDQINEFAGKVVSWLLILMIINVFIVVVLRYVFSYGAVWMQETYIWMHSIIFLVGAGYTLAYDAHVRIDLIYGKAGDQYRSVVNLICTLIFALPVLYYLFLSSLPFVERSWSIYEKSAETGGLHGVFLFKSVILLFCILFGLQFIALMIKSVSTFFRHK